MNRQFAPQVETQRVPPVGLQPAMHLAVHALRAVLERSEEFLAAFFSSMPEPIEGTSSGELTLVRPDAHAVQNALVRWGRAPNSGDPPCGRFNNLSIRWDTSRPEWPLPITPSGSAPPASVPSSDQQLGLMISMARFVTS